MKVVDVLHRVELLFELDAKLVVIFVLEGGFDRL